MEHAFCNGFLEKNDLARGHAWRRPSSARKNKIYKNVLSFEHFSQFLKVSLHTHLMCICII